MTTTGIKISRIWEGRYTYCLKGSESLETKPGVFFHLHHMQKVSQTLQMQDLEHKHGREFAKNSTKKFIANKKNPNRFGR